MDTNKRKTGLARLIEIAGTKRRLLIGAMLLAVITAIVQFVPIIAIQGISDARKTERGCVGLTHPLQVLNI